jgi:hypothetical protein
MNVCAEEACEHDDGAKEEKMKTKMRWSKQCIQAKP